MEKKILEFDVRNDCRFCLCYDATPKEVRLEKNARRKEDEIHEKVVLGQRNSHEEAACLAESSFAEAVGSLYDTYDLKQTVVEYSGDPLHYHKYNEECFFEPDDEVFYHENEHDVIHHVEPRNYRLNDNSWEKNWKYRDNYECCETGNHLIQATVTVQIKKRLRKAVPANKAKRVKVPPQEGRSEPIPTPQLQEMVPLVSEVSPNIPQWALPFPQVRRNGRDSSAAGNSIES